MEQQLFSDFSNFNASNSVNIQSVKVSQSAQLLLEKKHWTALLAVNGVGRKTLFKVEQALKKTQSSWDEFWVAKHRIWRACNLSEKQQESIKKFKKAYTIYSYWESLKLKQVSVVTYKDQNYPQQLQLIEDKPVILFVKSQVPYYWNQLPIAVVGTRKVSAYGELVTKKISRELVNYQVTIVSGFMYGVDLIAHKTAIDSDGQTVAVLGFGFDYMFPKAHQKIFAQMLNKGAIFVSEYAPHTSPRIPYFPLRNRIIAGMSLATVVTEAASKSGSLITAQLAAEYGREVFAVPGAITSPYSEGTKALVNNGATLISSGQEVIERLGFDAKQSLNVKQISQQFQSGRGTLTANIVMTALEQKIVETLRQQSCSLDQLTELVGLNLNQVLITLELMELKAWVRQEDGRYCLGGKIEKY